MKATTLIALGTLLGTSAFVAAQDAKEAPKHPERPIPPEVIAKFDTNKDGKLDDAERAAMKEAHKAEMLKKFDKDGDGKLNAEEEAAMKEAHKAEMLKKFDKDGDGKLSDEERKAMPQHRRPGGPGGKHHPGKGKGPDKAPDAAPAPAPAPQ